MEFLQKRLKKFIASYITWHFNFQYTLEGKENYTHTDLHLIKLKSVYGNPGEFRIN